ncbi:MAG: hypothetical protein COB85_01665 [Bacteroidetes bacterium]|nr:MAG: hypothetical protein COB85_01665 [Bacteroidota bacterium]
MKKSFSTAASIAMMFFIVTSGYSQDKCGTMRHLEMRLAQNPQLQTQMEVHETQMQSWIMNNPVQKKTGLVVTIPVVVHVVYNTVGQNISDAQILSQIDVLNIDFRRLNEDTTDTPDVFKGIAADVGFEFCMAARDPNGNPTDGITRTFTSETSFSTNDDVKFDASGGKNSWNTADYLNIWVCNLSGGVVGYAEFPFGGPSNTWGIVVTYWGFGTVGNVTAPYDVGRTAVHEVGHCFNLFHTWGDDGNACSGSDNVADTPDQTSSTSGCPSFPELDACSPDTPGVMFMNYMDYTNDLCINMFTDGQNARIQAIINSNKSSLKASLGCVPPNALDAGITITNPIDTACGTNAFYPEITLTNTGSDTLKSLSISYWIDSEPLKAYTWSGSLASLNSVQVILPPLLASLGQHTLSVFSEDPNGGIDGYLLNDSSEAAFTFMIGNSSTLSLNLGDFQLAQLFSWDVRDSAGIVIDSSGGYEKESSYLEIFCLSDGCYDLSLYHPPDIAVGSFSLTDAQGSVIASGNILTDTTLSFCVTLPPPIDTTSITEIVYDGASLHVYPNPFSSVTTIEFDNMGGEECTFHLYSVTGQIVREISEILTGEIVLERGTLVNGLYYYQLQNDNGVVGKGKLIIQ